MRIETDKAMGELEAIGVPRYDVATGHTGFVMMADMCHLLALRSGWWSDGYDSRRCGLEPAFLAAKLALVHSEVSEALEGLRKDLHDDHLPHRKSVEVELADAVIRIMDLAGYLNLDLAGAIIEKLAYNQQRADHKPEHRAAAGGKKF